MPASTVAHEGSQRLAAAAAAAEAAIGAERLHPGHMRTIKVMKVAGKAIAKPNRSRSPKALPK